MSDIFPDNDAAWQALGSILDPEFGISIADLGLIYSVECEDGNIHVVMTLTTPTCPSGAWIHGGVESALRNLPGARDVRVDLVFEPVWTPEMLTVNAREQLGWEAQNTP